jgi:hypothetical protein
VSAYDIPRVTTMKRTWQDAKSEDKTGHKKCSHRRKRHSPDPEDKILSGMEVGPDFRHGVIEYERGHHGSSHSGSGVCPSSIFIIKYIKSFSLSRMVSRFSYGKLAPYKLSLHLYICHQDIFILVCNPTLHSILLVGLIPKLPIQPVEDFVSAGQFVVLA